MASRSLNKVMLIGNLTRDPEVRYTPQGTAVCTIGVATNRSWNSDSGERQEETEYHRVVAWSKLAEICGQLLKKGRKIFVEGRLQTREWENKEGQKRQSTEIIMENMILLDAPGGRAEGEASSYAYPQEEEAGAKPAAKKGKSKQEDSAPPATGVSAVEDVSDDIPF